MRRSKPKTAGNRILAALSREDAERLKPHLQDIAVEPRQVLFEPGRVATRAYFLHDAFVSILTAFEDGPTVETATIGPEGVVGLSLLANPNVSPGRAVVQGSGRASAISSDRLQRAMNDSMTLRTLLGKYVHAFLAQALQTVACNAVHSTSERMARRLLMSADRTEGTGFALTHECLADMLGVGRPTVSLTARTLQTAGLIQYRRGVMQIVDRRGLEAASCPCYSVIRRAYEQLLPLTFK
jgi:CRP-like cAMP-binding protein